MSLQFNQTSSPYNGLIQRCEVNVYGEDSLGQISGNSTLLGLWTTRINQAKLKLDSVVLGSDGQWQHDDYNFTDLPTITADLVAGQRKYTFETDEDGNRILEIHKLYILSNGVYVPLEAVNEIDTANIYDGQSSTGTATSYGKKGTVAILDLVPAANVSDGLKAEVTREGYYFTTTDTAKTGGYALYDYVIADLACFEYGRFNTLSNTGLVAPYIQESMEEVKDYFSRRNMDVSKRLAITNHNNR